MTAARGQWFSSSPAKARYERFALIYSPMWIAMMGLVMLTGLYRSWDDPGYMAFGVLLAAPLILAPVLTTKVGEGASWRAIVGSTWLRINVWIAIFVFVGSYVCTHYFFDVVGMRYGFPTRWNFDATLVGHSDGEVPLFLYPVTQAYFMTYHVAATVALRWLSTRYELGALGRALVVAVLAYVVAFAETFFMAIPALADVFEYADRGRMLAWGSLFYGTFFVVSVPAFARVDEGERWTMLRTVSSALAVSMAVVLGLELWATLLGRL